MSRLKSMRKLLTSCLGLWLFLCAYMAAAETRVTTLVVPFSAGSAQDMFARLISEPLARELGASVMVDNKPGAGGTIASAFVANENQMARPICWPPTTIIWRGPCIRV
jgi:tripartite-type tricarboxylate transporter receptor subunit TctC